MKAGIYICECGPNIRDAVDINEIATFARGLEHVARATSFNLLCSEEGKNLIENDIKKYNLSHVIIAACTPKEHEITFRKVLNKAGLNPFFLQIVNIREQCAWVIKDRALATQKAKSMIAAAVKRVAFHEPLEAKEIQCESDALVVGAGIAGISAALTLAQKNRKVYLVERLPCIGGKAARFEKIYPQPQPPEVLRPGGEKTQNADDPRYLKAVNGQRNVLKHRHPRHQRKVLEHHHPIAPVPPPLFPPG